MGKIFMGRGTIGPTCMDIQSALAVKHTL